MTVSAKPVLGMILKGYPRISETFISNEILLLEQLGFTIHIFSMRHPREPFCHDSVNQIRAKVDYLPETISGNVLKLLYHALILAVKNPFLFAGALRMAGRRFLRTRKSATIKHLLQAGYLVHRLLPGSGVAHLHAHFAHSPTSVAMFASKLSRIPFSFTAHAKDIYTSDPRQLSEKIELSCFAATCTNYNLRYLNGLSNNTATPIHRIYHGIDISLFSESTDKKINTAAKIPYKVITVARLTPKKGLPTVLKAIRYLCDRGIPVKHALIGDGDDRKKIVQLIKDLGLEQITRLHGTLPHHEVLEYYRNADLFVLGCEVAPNGDRDGIPNVFLESMAMGVPVVATQVSAISELVEDGSTGLLVQPGCPENMGEAMLRLLNDNSLRQKIILGARNRVIREFDNQKLITDLAALFSKYCNLMTTE